MMPTLPSFGLNPFKSAESALLTAGAIVIGLWLIFNAGSNHGSQRAEVQRADAIVRTTEETGKAQGSVDKKVANLEVHAKVRRAHSEKKASDAVAQIQAAEPATDPVLIWAAAIDGLRNDQGDPDAAGAYSGGPVGRDPSPVHTPPTANTYSWPV